MTLGILARPDQVEDQDSGCIASLEDGVAPVDVAPRQGMFFDKDAKLRMENEGREGIVEPEKEALACLLPKV